ncbi:MAG: hypothetical protein HRU20_22845 [Pseudomonadales bacterium]|nr:hypothetical protein [Pseudomonadales bacterium]
MKKSERKTRLGDLLVKRGAITPAQLKLAVHEQRRLRLLVGDAVYDDDKSLSLGHILCDMGFIDQKLLTKTLKRQARLRKLAIVFAILAPLLSPFQAFAAKVSASSDDVITEQVITGSGWQNMIDTDDVTAAPEPAPAPAPDPEPAPEPTPESAPETAPEPAPAPGPEPAPEPGPGPEPDVNVASLSLSWSIPDSRESGEDLALYDIGGYEILFKKEGESLFTSEIINDAQVTEHQLFNLEPGAYEVQLASFDNEGLYSRYSTLHIVVN